MKKSVILLLNLLIEITVLGHIRERPCSHKVYIYMFKGDSNF